MAELDAHLLRWVVDSVDSGADVIGIHGLRAGGSPWRVQLRRGPDNHDVVLRVGDPRNAATTRVEQAALELAATGGVPVPRLLAADSEHDPPLLLIERVPGSSDIPTDRPSRRLRALGAAAAAIHRIRVPSDLRMPVRDRPIAGEDFYALRRQQPARPLLVEAEKRVAEATVDHASDGFVHGDLWQGNSMWAGDHLVSIIDWDCAGVGPAGVDLGSLRCDAAVCFGLEAIDDVLAGWEDESGRPADAVAYWDIVAALSTPPDMGWFVQAISDQGRPDLSQEILLRRRDAFLQSALDRLATS